jgi:hypothetical protein
MKEKFFLRRTSYKSSSEGLCASVVVKYFVRVDGVVAIGA